MTVRPRRSVLYMPGSNERALEKAKTIPADALILDLEDAVAPDAKVLARETVCAAVASGGYGTRGMVAVIWPPNRRPLVAAIYVTQTDASMDMRNAAIARLGEAIAAALELAP